MTSDETEVKALLRQRGNRRYLMPTEALAQHRPQGLRVERHLLNKAARMQGFLVWDYEHRYEEAVARLAAWVRQCRLQYREEILDGIEQAPGSISTRVPRVTKMDNDALFRQFLR